jgi:hypothetical protein
LPTYACHLRFKWNGVANGRKKAIQRDGCSQFQRQLELIKIDQEIRKEVEEHATAETNTLAAENVRLRMHNVRVGRRPICSAPSSLHVWSWLRAPAIPQSCTSWLRQVDCSQLPECKQLRRIRQDWSTASQHALVELMFKDGTVWRKRVEQAHRHPRSLQRWVIVGAAARASHLTAARMTCSAVLRLWPCLPCVVELTAAALLVCSAFVCRDRTGRALPLHNQGAPHSAESAQPDGLRKPTKAPPTPLSRAAECNAARRR